MAVSPAARSSMFHQRLEQRHVETYGDVRRARHRAFLTGAAALTRFNLGIARLFLDEDEAAETLLETALAEREQAFGPNNPEVAEIARVLSGKADAAEDDARMALYDGKIRTVAENRATDVLDAWRKEQPHEMTDTRRLLAAPISRRSSTNGISCNQALEPPAMRRGRPPFRPFFCAADVFAAERDPAARSAHLSRHPTSGSEIAAQQSRNVEIGIEPWPMKAQSGRTDFNLRQVLGRCVGKSFRLYRGKCNLDAGIQQAMTRRRRRS